MMRGCLREDTSRTVAEEGYVDNHRATELDSSSTSLGKR
jgi:hypothetical protein